MKIQYNHCGFKLHLIPDAGKIMAKISGRSTTVNSAHIFGTQQANPLH